MPLVSTFGGASSKGFGLFSAPAAVLDQYFEYVTLLLPGNGTNGAQNNTFLDSSTNNFTITRNGNTTQGTFSPYGDNWSNYFDGSGDYLTAPASSAYQLTGDFSVEAFVYWDGTFDANARFVYGTGGAGNTDQFLILAPSQAPFDGFYYAGLATNEQPPVNQWVHLLATRQGTTVRLFVNGVLKKSGSVSGTIGSNATAYVGRRVDGNHNWFGYISNLRVINGSPPSVYQTSSTTVGAVIFTPPTSPLTAITNTSLLTCQSNRFRDASTNNFTITRNGDVSVQRFSPFNPTASYASGTIGGSGYFDGNSDYLTVPSTTAFDMNGDFTLEMWVYPNQLNQSNTATVFACGNTSVFQLNTLASGSKIEWYANGPAIISVSYLGYLQLKQWNHLVACRTGTTLAIFVNGTRLGTATDSTSYDLSQLYLSFQPASSHFLDGYMGDVRVIKGSGPYNATLTTLTVPTAPLTAITNTSLLLNFTNAGIIDNAMMNDLETVGNAQISTTQSKFGGSSMYFDGTGDNVYQGPVTPNQAFGTGDFTVECWYYPNATQTRFAPLVGAGNGTAAGALWQLYFETGNLVYFADYNTAIVGATSAISNTTWTHIAVTRSGTTVRLFINGTQVSSATSSINFVPTGVGFFCGQNPFTVACLNGYLDDVRVTKGVARYTANFTPPTAAFPTR